jgi:hypothetical protein
MKKSTMLDLLVLVIRRDLVLAMRRRADVLTTLIFFVMVVSLFPLGVGPELDMLRKMAPGVLWVAALLASMLSLGRLFSADYLDGTLEQMMLAPQSLSMLVLGKMAAHWMVSGLPLVLMAPVLGLQFDMSMRALGVLIVGLMLGTPILSMLGANIWHWRSRSYNKRVKHRFPFVLVGCFAGVGSGVHPVGDRPGFTHFDGVGVAYFDGVMIWRLTGSSIPHLPPFTAWPGR